MTPKFEREHLVSNTKLDPVIFFCFKDVYFKISDLENSKSYVINYTLC